MKITIVQPFVAHYRESFYKKLSKFLEYDICCVEKPQKKESFKISSSVDVSELKTVSIYGLILFNIFSNKFLKNKIIVLNFSPKWLTAHIFLFIKFFLNKKVILWTHGVSVMHGFHPTSFKDRIKLYLFNLADGICFYTKNELEILSNHLKRPELFYINNTLDVKQINNNLIKITKTKKQIKKEYGIKSSKVVIFCARFTQHRRADILLEFINTMSDEDISFIIIGDGIYKPNFCKCNNVFDFGKVYDEEKKSELFKISDFNFQPAWSGLSVIESFANEVPFITMKKSHNIRQCVEYGYIDHGKNGFIFESLDEVKELICGISEEEICVMKNYCRRKALKDLNMDQMVNKFYEGILMTIEDST